MQEVLQNLANKRISYDMCENILQADDWFTDEEASTEKPDLSREKAALRMLMQDCLTKKQKCYILLYYRDGLTVMQIAQKFGVDKSTVSRTINRGRQRIAGNLSREAMRRLFEK